MKLLTYGLFLFLAVFNAGNMTTLQIQHYGIYPFVGRENFQAYMRANNAAAFVPSILPAMLLLVVNVVLLFYAPPFMSQPEVVVLLALNVGALVSTFVWQRRLQGEMAVTGFDDAKIRLLIATNWIRTGAFLLEGCMAVAITVNALSSP